MTSKMIRLTASILTLVASIRSAGAWLSFSCPSVAIGRSFASGHLQSQRQETETGVATSSSPTSITIPEGVPVASSVQEFKTILLQLGAMLDRGQAYNPTSGDYYAERMQVARNQISAFLESNPDKIPTSMEEIEGEWELVLSTVPHGIFRSSPFFLAVQEAFDIYAENKEAFGMPKSTLFFKLHELQTMSWGVSKVGRVAQHVTKDFLYSEFDTSIFSMTVIPILGWFKLLPTFGGCVVTVAKAHLDEGGLLKMTVDYTTSRPVSGLSGLGKWIWSIKVPVGAIWKRLPWNKGREAYCQVWVRYCDDDFRIVEDRSGDMFVYTRPVVPRPLDLAME